MTRPAACLLLFAMTGCGSEHARDVSNAQELGDGGSVETAPSPGSPPPPAGEPTPATESEDAGTSATVDPTPSQVDAGDAATVDPDAGDSSPSPALPAFCGNGRVDPGESCDPGSGFAGPACSYYCDTLDFCPITGTSSTSASRTLGRGRHPLAANPNGDFAVAYIETVSGNVTVKLAPLDVHGSPRGAPVTLATGAQAQAEADPVVAALGGSSYVAAWTGFVDGDELGVALRVIDPSTPGRARSWSRTRPRSDLKERLT